MKLFFGLRHFTTSIFAQATKSTIETVKIFRANANYNDENGKLLWKIQVNPRQSHKERFIYSVKYPKNQVVNGTR